VPIPIAHLFDDDQDIHCYPTEKDIEKMSKGWHLIPLTMSDIPDVPPPEIGTKLHNQDILDVKQCFTNPVNNLNFLKESDKKTFKLFEKFCHDNRLRINVDHFKELNDQLSSLILNLKFMYNRPRPKKHMDSIHDTFPYERIQDMDSPSYPSGHTAHAFFNAGIISSLYPECSFDVKLLAEKIAQSRIDLGKHYPTDCAFGRYIGEAAAQACISGKVEENPLIKEAKLTSEQRKKARNVFRDAMKNHDTKSFGSTYIDELCEFIIQSNLIERYVVPTTEAFSAAKAFMRGLPVEYCTENKFIHSHLSALECASLLGNIDSPVKIQNIHLTLGQDVMERGIAGKFRDFDHYARNTGYQYTHPNNILNDINHWCAKDFQDNFSRHVAYECIHPFSDCNGRSGRIILASDENFDFIKVNNLITSDYIPRIIKHQV